MTFFIVTSLLGFGNSPLGIIPYFIYCGFSYTWYFSIIVATTFNTIIILTTTFTFNMIPILRSFLITLPIINMTILLTCHHGKYSHYSNNLYYCFHNYNYLDQYSYNFSYLYEFLINLITWSSFSSNYYSLLIYLSSKWSGLSFPHHTKS